MKKSLIAMLLVIALVMSCICSVSAATMTKDEFLALCAGLQTEIEVPVDIAGKKDEGTYGDTITAQVDDSAAFKATLDMTNVKDVVQSVLDEAELILSTEEFNDFKDLEVTGEFEISATWSGVENPATINSVPEIEACFIGIDGFFEIEEANVVGNTIQITMQVIAGTKVTALATLLSEITLEIDGFTVVDDGEMKATIEGTTQILNPLSTSYDVEYVFVDSSNSADTSVIKPVVIDVDTGRPQSGGSTTISTFNTLKYETNGGATIADESYVSGKTVQLTKVPEKEGYTFEGWYADAALTQKITSVKMDADVTVYAAWKAIESDEPVIVHPVPEMLNGADHYAYLSGYQDGTIRPDSSITRAEVATIFFRLLKDEVREQYLTTENVFTDVNEGDWYNTAISTMAKAGVVNGRYADTFAPDEYITRAEFTTICARFDDANEAGANKFTDVSDHWAEDYILEAVAYNWIDGYEDYTFRPEEDITRAETATLINRVLNRVPENAEALLDTMKVWPDNADTAWYYVAVQEATNSHTYERVNEFNEKWLELTENRDWTVYEK